LEKFIESLPLIFSISSEDNKNDKNNNNDIINKKNLEIKKININLQIQYSILKPWIRNEIINLAYESEILFLNVKSISELKIIFIYFKNLFLYFDKKELSGKYIFDDCFNNNIKYAINSVFNTLQINPKLSFDLKEYTIYKNNSSYLIYFCIGQINEFFESILEFLIFLMEERYTKQEDFLHMIFIEQYFLQNILLKIFFDNLDTLLKEADSYNFIIKAINNKIYLDKNGIPIQNQILLNWTISLYEISRIFQILLNEINENRSVLNNTYFISINKAYEKSNKFKTEFLAKLFKTRTEMYLFNGFAIMKENEIFQDLKDTNEIIMDINISIDNLPEYHKIFYVYYLFIKSMSINVKLKITDKNNFLLINIFLENLYFKNFKDVILNLKDLNERINLDFSFKNLTIEGLEAIVIGMYFLFNLLIIGFEIENENENEEEYKNRQGELIENIINEYMFATNKIDECNIISKKKDFYQENTKKYIYNNLDLLKF